MELQPIESVYPKLGKVSSVQVMECDIDEIESRFDDLYEAQRLVSEYKDKGGELDSDMKQFISVINKTLRTFRSAISSLDDEKVEKLLDMYEEGGGYYKGDYAEKFATCWRELLTKKVCIRFL